jgi:hypothetical protein
LKKLSTNGLAIYNGTNFELFFNVKILVLFDEILEIYNNPAIHKHDKRNAINAIINGDKVISAKPRELNSMHISAPISMANSADKSSSTKKIKKIKKTSGGKKSTKKSRTKKTRK